MARLEAFMRLEAELWVTRFRCRVRARRVA